MNSLKEKFKDSIVAILPVMIIMVLLSSFLGFSIVSIVSIIISTVLIIFGITLFTYGADLSMMEIGSNLGSSLVKTRKILLILVISVIVGIIITISEPDLSVLATQMSSMNTLTFILLVSLGVGIFLGISTIRIIYKINLKLILLITYGIVLILMLFVKKEMIPIAFDSGGVTTGPMSVPFIIALGVGFSKSRSRKESKDDSFGLISLCSIGPVIIVLLVSLLSNNELTYSYNISEEIINISSLFKLYLNTLLPTFKDVLISLLPILVLFIIYNIITKTIIKNKLKKVVLGLVLTFIGLSLFFIGVNAGYMKIAYLLGISLYEKNILLLFIMGIILGFVIVKAEPAVAVLTEQIEDLTMGSISKKIMNNAIAIGVAIGITLSIIRVIYGIDILPILLIGYAISLVLMFFTPKLFTMIAFDSGGAVTGPMTSSFLLPLIIGVCYAKGGNVLTDAFGVVALIALSPIVVIQLLGIVYKIKLKIEESHIIIDESIVEYDWKCNYE